MEESFFTKVKNSISQKFKYLIKLMFVLVADLYLKKFIQFEISSLQSTLVDDNYILKVQKLKLNKQKLNGSFFKNRNFKIADSNIDQIIVPLYDYGGTINIDNVQIDLDNIDPDNPTGSYAVSIGQSLILEAQKLVELQQSTGSLCFDPNPETETDGIFLSIKELIQVFVDQFKITINRIEINFRHLDLVFSFKNIVGQQKHISFQDCEISQGRGNILVNVNHIKVEWVDNSSTIQIKHVEMAYPEMTIINSLKSLTVRSGQSVENNVAKNTDHHHHHQSPINICINELVIRKNEHLVYVQNLRSEITKSDQMYCIHLGDVKVKNGDNCILDANECEVTFMIVPDQTTSRDVDPELFAESSTIYAGTVKPSALKDKNCIYNYIRKQIWGLIINVNVNTLNVNNTGDAVNKLIQDILVTKKNKDTSHPSESENTASYRVQISVNNIDIQNVQPEIDITGIRSCIYIDPIYIIGLSKYIICTSHDTHLTDPIFVYLRDPHESKIGMSIKVAQVCLDKLVTQIQKKIKTPKQGSMNMSSSQPDLQDLEVVHTHNKFSQNLFRSQQVTPSVTTKTSTQSANDFIIVCESLTLNYKLVAEPSESVLTQTVGATTATTTLNVSNYVLELENTELYSVTSNKTMYLNTTKVVCNDVITFESVHWKWDQTGQHNFSIDSIIGVLRPKDLSNLFPQNVQSKVKQKLKAGEIKKLDNYFESEALQKFLEKVINPRDQDGELKRLDLVNIIPDYLTQGVKPVEIRSEPSGGGVIGLLGQLSVRNINMQFIQETGGPSCVNLEVDRLKMELSKETNKFLVRIPNLRIRDYVDGSVWSNIAVTKDIQVTFVGGTLDITTPHRMYLNLDKRALRFMNNYSKDTKIAQGKSMIRRIFTSHLEIIVSVKSTISLKDSKITVTPMRIEGPNLSEKIILKLLMDNDKLAILLEGIKPLRPFVKIIRDGIAILNIQDRSGRTVTERIQKFLHTSAAEILELGAEIGSLPESERNKISFYANQPLNVKTGFTDAGKEFVTGIEAIMNLIKQKSKAGVLDIPLIMIRPFTNSISKVMLGVLNEMDPERREIALNKY